MLFGLTAAERPSDDARACPDEGARRRALRTALARKGFRDVVVLGNGVVALSALRELAPEAALPAAPARFTCPVCATALAADHTPEYQGCPSCGHGLVARDFLAPIQCDTCARIVESPAPFMHREGDLEEGARCKGTFGFLAVLPFDVVQVRDEVILVGDDGELARALELTRVERP